MAVALSSAACAVFLILGVLVYRAVASSTASQFDEMLQQEAALALRYADHEYGEGESLVPPSLIAPGRPMPRNIVYQIVTHSNELLYRSPGAPPVPLTVRIVPGFSSALVDRHSWRVYSLGSASTPLIIHIAEPLEFRNAFLSRILRAVAVPVVFALVLLTVLIGVVTERAFRPVRRIAADLAGRGADDLSAVNTAAMPKETHALGVALNGLMARQAELLARERRFTADAAHELRTPLAALRAQAQVAARAKSPGEARRALEKLQANIDRTAHLMSQLLSLARLEPGTGCGAGQTTPSAVIMDLLFEELAQTARDRQVELTVSGREQRLPGPPEMLYLLVRNLLENSVRHVSQRGHVSLAVTGEEPCAVLCVRDDGPGIPVAERQRVFERFYRIPGSASDGSGLGLSIVGRVVELLGGDITLADPASGTGLVVTVRLPRGPRDSR